MSKASYEKGFKPRPAGVAKLERAWEIIQATPYRPSLRYVFYKLYQEGFFKEEYRRYEEELLREGKPGKSVKDRAYRGFKDLTANARRRFYKDWRPESLGDDTRQVDYVGGWSTPEKWLGSLECKLDPWHEMEFYCEIWVEGRGMVPQFRYYTLDFTIRAMGGNTSITQLWRGIQEISSYPTERSLVLYFGDDDPKGREIFEGQVLQAMHHWEFTGSVDATWCGLTSDQAKHYRIPDHPLHKGRYQWGALDDHQAGELILECVGPYLPRDRSEEEALINKRMSGLLEGLEDE